eukprot:7388575-Prymnesium_polylepis.1
MRLAPGSLACAYRHGTAARRVYCCMTCRSGTPCTGNYHSQPFTSAKLDEAAVNGPLVWPCIAEGCPCAAYWSGMAGEPCCKTCRGGIPCAADYHS